MNTDALVESIVAAYTETRMTVEQFRKLVEGALSEAKDSGALSDQGVEAYDRGFSAGYDEGHAIGFDEGYEAGGSHD